MSHDCMSHDEAESVSDGIVCAPEIQSRDQTLFSQPAEALGLHHEKPTVPLWPVDVLFKYGTALHEVGANFGFVNFQNRGTGFPKPLTLLNSATSSPEILQSIVSFIQESLGGEDMHLLSSSLNPLPNSLSSGNPPSSGKPSPSST